MRDATASLAVLVVSCDKYSDLWGPFFKLFARFWPDCPFRVYLLTNHQEPGLRGVTTLSVGDDISWSDNLLRALEMIEQDHVLLFIEDLFLLDFVNTWEVVRVLEWMLKNGANYVRMNPYPGPDAKCNDIVGRISRGAIYRTSTVVPLWRKGVLSELLAPGESAWDFEVSGSARSDGYGGFYSTWRTHFPVMNTVIKSKWRRGAVRRLKALGLEANPNGRPVMSPAETAGHYYRRTRAKALRLFPSKHRRKIKDLAETWFGKRCTAR